LKSRKVWRFWEMPWKCGIFIGVTEGQSGQDYQDRKYPSLEKVSFIE
jgi:hypothetical protein